MMPGRMMNIPKRRENYIAIRLAAEYNTNNDQQNI